jgi:hypothetical protein
MRSRRKKTTLRLTLSAAICALGIVMLWLGGLVQIIDLSMAVLVSMLVVFAVIELKGSYPYLIYAVTSVLSILLLPTNSAALTYVLFAGYYPIVKALLEGHLPRVVAWAIKLVLFCAAVAGALLLAEFVLLWDLSWVWAHWYLLPLLAPIFVLYDVVLTRMITAYLLRWRERLRIPEL